MNNKKLNFNETVYWIKQRHSYKIGQLEQADFLFLMGLFETDELTCISGLKYNDWVLDWVRE